MPDMITFGRPITLALEAGGKFPCLYLHQRPETISILLRAHRVWQREVTLFLRHYLRNGDVFVDVGANIGYFTVYAGLCVGSGGQVHAVEPDGQNVQLLEANTVLNTLANVRVHHTALADSSCNATLFRHADNAGAHSLRQAPGLAEGPCVAVSRLDELLAGQRSPRLIKIDVQGAEVPVLRGAAGLLGSQGERPAIILEFAPAALERAGEIDELFAFIETHHFSLHAFIANSGPSVVPPPIRRATLREIARDFVTTGHNAEFDLLLLPRV